MPAAATKVASGAVGKPKFPLTGHIPFGLNSSQGGADRALAHGERRQYACPHRASLWGWLLGIVLKFSRAIDALNDVFGVAANWLVLLACLISAGNAMSRYAIGANSNAWLEVQWYMFAGMVLLGGPYTLKVNEHVRVDLVYGMISDRARIWIDLIGALLFLLPICIILVYFTWPWFVESWTIGETSSNAGGLVRWPVKLVLPLGFSLMALQGVSEVIKRIAALRGDIKFEYQYEKPLQ